MLSVTLSLILICVIAYYLDFRYDKNKRIKDLDKALSSKELKLRVANALIKELSDQVSYRDKTKDFLIRQNKYILFDWETLVFDLVEKHGPDILKDIDGGNFVAEVHLEGLRNVFARSL